MRLDEMIIKANADGKTYFCNGTYLEYSKEKGFTEYNLKESRRKFADVVCTGDWKEKPKRHLTVSEAEKELDCEIDTPDISKLFRPMSEKPDNGRNVILVYDDAQYFYNHCGHYTKTQDKWFDTSKNAICLSFRWIDPADLIKLLPKE